MEYVSSCLYIESGMCRFHTDLFVHTMYMYFGLILEHFASVEIRPIYPRAEFAASSSTFFFLLSLFMYFFLS